MHTKVEMHILIKFSEKFHISEFNNKNADFQLKFESFSCQYVISKMRKTEKIWKFGTSSKKKNF